jgi:apolipoprotein N-acyltransferase
MQHVLPKQRANASAVLCFCDGVAIGGGVMRYPKMLALAAGALSAIGFAPISWWPVTLICFALLLLVSRAKGWKPAAARGYWFGVGHFTVGLNWIAGSFQFQDTMPHWLGWFAVVALAFYLAVYPAICAGGAWWLSTRRHSRESGNPTALLVEEEKRDSRFRGNDGAGFVLIFASLWIITEWLRATMFTGFAWNPLGVVLVPTHLDQYASTLGTYGLSGTFILMAALLLAIYDHLKQRGIGWPKSGSWIGIIFGVIFVLPPIYFMVSGIVLDPVDEGGAHLIRIIQPNIGQQDKHVESYKARNFAKLTALTGAPKAEPRLIFWPEAAVPDYIGQNDEKALRARQKLARLIGPDDILLTGAVKLETRDKAFPEYIERSVVGARNSLFALDRQGRILGRYDKAHLVPYGEYLPMTSVLSAIGLSRLVPGSVDFWPGPGARTISLPGFGKMGVQICYEIIFSGQVVDGANRPDFLFNPSNDAWFGSWGPPQHLAQARLRAIEEGLPIIRSTPTGISAVIDANGNVLHKLPFQKAGYIETQLPPPHEPTFFARHGNIISLAFAFFLGALGIASGRFRR